MPHSCPLSLSLGGGGGDIISSPAGPLHLGYKALALAVYPAERSWVWTPHHVAPCTHLSGTAAAAGTAAGGW